MSGFVCYVTYVEKNATKRNMSSAVCASSMYKSLAPISNVDAHTNILDLFYLSIMLMLFNV